MPRISSLPASSRGPGPQLRHFRGAFWSYLLGAMLALVAAQGLGSMAAASSLTPIAGHVHNGAGLDRIATSHRPSADMSTRLRGGGAGAEGAGGGGGGGEERVLVLDVDNCLYHEATAGIERQIVEGIHRFCAGHHSLSAADCDRLHKEHGSTIAGLKKEVRISRDQETEFYEQVYGSIDYSKLLGLAEGDGTGYHHETSLVELLRRVNSPVYLASNSPRSHVYKVLAALGLRSFQWAGIITPDSNGYATKGDASFWGGLIESYPGHQIWLADDSTVNLKVAEGLGFNVVPVGGAGGVTIQNAICTFMGIIPEHRLWSFDPVKYIRSKNNVDRVSFCPAVKHALKMAVESLGLSSTRPLRVVDVGAGLLSMLEEVVSIARELEAGLEYEALETEQVLFKENVKMLAEAGYTVTDQGEGVTRMRSDEEGVTVALRRQDFRSVSTGEFKDADVFVMCCFSDLMSPDALVKSVLRALAGNNVGVLVYSPITFCGRTSLDPPQPASGNIPSDEDVFEAYHLGLEKDQGHNLDVSSLIASVKAHGGEVLAQGPSDWVIPGPGHLSCDTTHKEGHKEVDYFDAPKEENAAIYSEQWRLWNTMVYFFATGTAARAPPQWDMRGWVKRLRRTGPIIDVGNSDLLWRSASIPQPLEPLARTSGSRTAAETEKESGTFLEFYAVKKVRVNQTDVPEAGPGELLLETLRSAVSSGTELKVFTGDFDTGAQLDTTIEDMKDASMSYPLQYGYSLVGRVVAVGQGVQPSDWLGRNVFAFAPHGSHAIVSASSAIAVPDGIAPEDACYFPAVETALSLVQEANPVVGENVCVFGQGIIGLLVTAILAGSHGSSSLTSVEMNPQRSSMSKRMGAGTVLHPRALGADGAGLREEEEKFDVSIEVSGNWRALQSAIDNTGESGRVIIGSWYGGDAAKLRLGIDFHRSHISLKASQVSKIPAHLSGRWDKSRRFQEAWKWVAKIRPSSVLGTYIVPLKEAQGAYEALLVGNTVGVEFTYQ